MVTPQKYMSTTAKMTLMGMETRVMTVGRGLDPRHFSLLAFGFAVAGATHNSVLPLTLLCVGVGLGLEAIGAFAGLPAFGIVGAWFLIGASALATYMLVEKFYWRTMGRHVLPLGPAWIAGSADPES